MLEELRTADEVFVSVIILVDIIEHLGCVVAGNREQVANDARWICGESCIAFPSISWYVPASSELPKLLK